jgi:protein involved in polysaccharide export with SLBB domain
MPTDSETHRALVCVPRAGQDWETEVTIARLRNSGFGPGRQAAGNTPALITVEAALPLLAGMTARKVSDGVSGSLADENYRLGGGDRLRIRFYDRRDRDDLNGEYLIGESGQLRLPRIGVFAARDKKVGELEREIRRGAESRGERLGYFTIDVTQCRPFYIAGLVNSPGAYPYVPGYTVLHAVSIAGGLYRAPLESAAGPMRERRVLTETMDRIAELMARRARLEAERDDAGAIRVPEELAELEPLRAAELIASETSLLCRSREAARRERAGLESVIQLAIAEFESHRASLARMEERIQEQTGALGRLRTLHRRGTIDERPLFEAAACLNAAERGKREAFAGLTRATGEVQRAREELSLLALSASSRAAGEIAQTDREIARLKAVAAETRQLATAFDTLSGHAGAGQTVTYRIMRRGASGEPFFEQATETTPIKPGDVIQIESGNALGALGRPAFPSR